MLELTKNPQSLAITGLQVIHINVENSCAYSFSMIEYTRRIVKVCYVTYTRERAERREGAHDERSSKGSAQRV